MTGRIYVCSECSATAAGEATGRGCGLPRAWEHHDPAACPDCVSTSQRPPREDARPVCGTCIDELLDLVMAELCRAYGVGA